MKTSKLFILGPILIICAACSGRGNVDLAKATPLTAEPVPTPSGNGNSGGTPVQTGSGPMFNSQPGAVFKLSALGSIDPVGTSLAQDFDGDGIPNDKEITSNFWLADYPLIETQITAPITMQIAIQKSSNGESNILSTDINSDDFESKKNEGSDNFHQKELGLKTERYETEHSGSSSSSSASASTSASASGGSFLGTGGSAEVNVKLDINLNSTSQFSDRVTVFEDRPNVNNIDREARSVKSDNAATKARNYRQEKRGKVNESSVVGANAGYVRAAMYIKNRSVNMPVTVSNILCSLVFETKQGELIPVQSFRLRNDDFSLFRISVYGNSEFGPYVVELNNLNTVEIEKAIANGYTPKIYIVDYDLEHVPDSGYRAALSSSFAGNNLKIIEENAKGRTALIKLFGRNLREMFRVVAYDPEVTGDICSPTNVNQSGLVKVGSTMRKALQRIACSGYNIQFGYYLLDFTGSKLFGTSAVGLYPRVLMSGVKSINGYGTNFTCYTGDGAITTGQIPDPINPGAYVTINNVCHVKIAKITQDELFGLSMWTIFDNGKYFDPARIMTINNTTAATFVAGQTVESCDGSDKVCGVPIFPGVDGTIWAGDNYDISYLSFADILGQIRRYGTNPLETGAALNFNTKWDGSSLGTYPFDPEIRSRFLGQAMLGDTVEIVFNLRDTMFLNPNFGGDLDPMSALVFTNFTYGPQKATKKFNIDEAIDFEMSMGLGGEASDWQSVMRPVPGANKIQKVSTSVDYLAQKFTVNVKIPSSHTLVDPQGAVNLYLRPALSNAYRNVLWPQDYRYVKKYDAKINAAAASGVTVQIKSGIGAIADIVTGSDSLKIVTDGVVYTYGISSISAATSYGHDITLSSAVSGVTHKPGDRVYVDAGLTGPVLSLNVDYTNSTNNFFSAYNGPYPQQYLMPDNSSSNCLTAFLPTRCYGYSSSDSSDFVVNNWLGGIGFMNNWSDAVNLIATFANTYSMPFTMTHSPDWQRLMLMLAPGWGTSYFLSPDFRVSSANTGSQENPKVAVSQSRALVTWSSNENGLNKDLRGRVVDLQTGAAIGTGDFLISSTNIHDQANGVNEQYVYASENKALVVWTSGDNGIDTDIRGRFVDLQTGVPVGGADFLVSTSNGFTQDLPRVVATGGKYFVIWRSSDNGVDFNIRGRFVSAQSGLPSGTSDFLVSTSNYGIQDLHRVSVAGDRALVVWYSNDNGIQFKIRGRVVDISGEALIDTTDFLVFSSGAGGFNQSSPAVAAIGTKAMVVWHSNEAGGSDYDIRGRLVDLQTATPLGAGDFLISTFNHSLQVQPEVTGSGDRALVAWHSYDTGLDYDIRGRFIDMQTGTTVGNYDFLVSTTNAGEQGWPVLASKGNTAVVAWHSFNPARGDHDVLGRLYSLNPGRPFETSDFLISSTTPLGSNQLYPEIAIANDKAILVWHSNDNGADNDIRSATITLPSSNLPYGQNNFFTAPLIERNYTVTSKIKF